MIFEYLFFNNSLTYSHCIFILSLSFSLSLLLLSNKERGKRLSLKVVGNWLSKYDSSKNNPVEPRSIQTTTNLLPNGKSTSTPFHTRNQLLQKGKNSPTTFPYTTPFPLQVWMGIETIDEINIGKLTLKDTFIA